MLRAGMRGLVHVTGGQLESWEESAVRCPIYFYKPPNSLLPNALKKVGCGAGRGGRVAF